MREAKNPGKLGGKAISRYVSANPIRSLRLLANRWKVDEMCAARSRQTENLEPE